MCAAATVTEPIPAVRVSDHLRNPHPLVATTQILAKDARKDADGRLFLRPRGGLDALVVSGSLRRAMRIMDAILKHVESLGHHIGVAKQPPFSTYVTMGNQRVAFQLRERMIRTQRRATKEDPYPYPRFDSQPTGTFTLEIKEYIGAERKVWSDGKRRPLEAQLGAFVRGLERAAKYREAQHQRFLEAERAREAERIRQAQVEERHRAEQQKLDDLMDQVSRWQQCEALRRFVAAMRVAAVNKYGTVEDGSELDAWLTWALRVADRNDPVQHIGHRDEA